jgi:type I restriction enzyme S subunit
MNIDSPWQLARLSAFTQKIGSGVTPKGGSSVYVSGGIPFIRSQNVADDRLDLSDVAFIDPETHSEMTSSHVRSHDVLLNITGASIGRSCVVPPDFVEGNVNQHVCIIRPIECLDPYFLQFYLSSDLGQKQIDLCQAGGNRQGLNYDQIGRFKIPLPPLSLQHAIVRVLSTWDRGIRQLSDLIAAKLRFKQGLMQQLLTGKRRFKEFRDDWKSMRIGDVAEVRFSGIDKKTLDGETPVRLCNYLDVYRNEMIRDDMVFMNGSATSREIESLSLRKHDVLITKDSETPDDIAKAAYVVGDLDNVVLGYHLGLLRPYETVFGPYLSRLVMSPIMRYRFTRIANGATRYGLPLAATKRINIQVPSSIDEQQKIANVADLADHEIDLLRKELDALKTQKKGLMQKLLTGQVRVKLPKGGG